MREIIESRTLAIFKKKCVFYNVLFTQQTANEQNRCWRREREIRKLRERVLDMSLHKRYVKKG